MVQYLSKIKSLKGAKTREAVIRKKKTDKESTHIEKVAFSLDSLIFARASETERVIRKKRIILASSACLLLIVLGGLYAPKGVAESATFYPKSCLGGWINPTLAQGQPEVSANTAMEEFSQENSALLAADTNADMYCGNFTGDFPEKTHPTSIILSLSWATGPNINHAKAIIGTSFASSSAAILDGTSSDVVSFTLATTTEDTSITKEEVVATSLITDVPDGTSTPSLLDAIVNQIKDTLSDGPDGSNSITPKEEVILPLEELPSTPSSVEVTPVSDPAPATDAPTSFLDSLVKRIATTFIESAYAEDVPDSSVVVSDTPVIAGPVPSSPSEENSSVIEQPVEETSVSKTSESADTATSQTTQNTDTSVQPVRSEESVSSTTPETTVEVPVAPPAESDSSFLEVLYTFDGITWSSLGKVNEVDMVSRNFEILTTATTTWDDMSHLQIKIQTVQRLDHTPAVYLDGIKVSVTYDHTFDGAHPDFARDSILEETKDSGIHAVRIKNSDTDEYEVWYSLEVPLENTNLATSTWYQFTDPSTWPTRETIIYSMTDHRPPGLTTRTLSRDIVIDKHATHACHAAVFSVDISGVSTSTAKIFFNEDEQAVYKAEIGGLPEGINVTFIKNGLYEEYPTQDDTSLDMQIVNQDGAVKGNFTIPIIFTKNLGHESTVLCQINLVNL